MFGAKFTYEERTMPSNKKEKKMEPGIWRVGGAKGNEGPYIAEVSFSDPQTQKRVRVFKTIRLLEDARTGKIHRNRTLFVAK